MFSISHNVREYAMLRWQYERSEANRIFSARRRVTQAIIRDS